jgi:hypothetical protein
MDLTTTIMICSMFHANVVVNAIIQNGSQAHPLAITKISQAGTSTADFKKIQTAAQYAKTQLAQGNAIEIGMMQIPSGWLVPLSKNGLTLENLLRRCKNIAVATDLLNQSEAYCATFTDTGAQRDQCTLSFYKTGDPKAGLDYAKQILDYANANPLKMPLTSAPVVNTTTAINYNSVLEDSSFALPKPIFSEDEGDTDVNAK